MTTIVAHTSHKKQSKKQNICKIGILCLLKMHGSMSMNDLIHALAKAGYSKVHVTRCVYQLHKAGKLERAIGSKYVLWSVMDEALHDTLGALHAVLQ
jgi:DNA-binding transcriptional regulator PaaX